MLGGINKFRESNIYIQGMIYYKSQHFRGNDFGLGGSHPLTALK